MPGDNSNSGRMPWNGHEIPVIPAAAYSNSISSLSAKFNKSAARGLKNHQSYHDAKSRGNAYAAGKVIKSLMSDPFLNMAKGMLQKLSGHIILVAPVKENSQNRLASEAAKRLGSIFGITVDDKIVENDVGGRAGLSGIDRLFVVPGFVGEVERGGIYVGVDDVVSSGTTMAQLRDHIERYEGHFAGVLCLATPSGSPERLNISRNEASRVSRLYDQSLKEWFTAKAGFGFEELTYGEMGILTSKRYQHDIKKKYFSDSCKEQYAYQMRV